MWKIDRSKFHDAKNYGADKILARGTFHDTSMLPHIFIISPFFYKLGGLTVGKKILLVKT
jgi:hypothetical protein